ncbi:MAG TPA: ankyrin repeat domain-containing protein [Bacilli bacterium]|nr:ankyrin repeat domain-containing protein [Bacilli bacterium]
MKKWMSAAVILLLLMTAGGAASATGNDVGVVIDGKVMQFEQPATIVHSKTLVPLRAIFEELGAKITWDGDTRTVTAVKDTITVKLTIGSDLAYRNNQRIELEQAPLLMHSHTMVPVRFVAEALNANVKWDAATHTVLITKFSPLIGAIEQHDNELARQLIADGIDVNLQDDHNDTALTTAIAIGNREIVQLLLGSGADVNLADSDGDTAVTVAAYFGETEILQDLLATEQANVTVKNKRGLNALMLAAWQNHSGTVQALLDAGAPVDEPDTLHQRTALHFAVMQDALEATRLLLAAGADVNKQDEEGHTPLYVATRSGNAAMIELLQQ